MADEKLNEVTKVTDMAYVPVIMADGSIGQIAKADLASVVAGIAILNINKSYADDLNNAVGYNESGMFNASTLNLPSSISGVGTYTVFRANYGSNQNLFLAQLLFPEESVSRSTIYIRRCWNNIWSSWKAINLS